MRPPRSLLYAFIALAVAAGGLAIAPRIRAEQSNHSVDVVLDYSGVLDFCSAEGLEVPDALALFKRAGVTALAYSELSLDRLRSEGRVNDYAGDDFLRALRSHAEVAPAGVTDVKNVKVDPGKVYLMIYDPKLLPELKVYLNLCLGSAPESPALGGSLRASLMPSPSATPAPGPTESLPGASSPTPAAATPAAAPTPTSAQAPFHPRWRIWPSAAAAALNPDRPTVLEVDTSDRALSTTPLGFSREDLGVARDAGLKIYLRPQNREQFTEHDVRRYFAIVAKLKRYGVKGVIFEGVANEVMGYPDPDKLRATVEALRQLGLLYGDIEVPTVEARQKGAETLGIDLADQSVRVMSLSPGFQAKMTPEVAIDKYMLGVKERNIRLLYARFYAAPQSGMNLVETNFQYLSGLKAALDEARFRTAGAEAFPAIRPPLWALMLLSLGVAAAGLLLLERFVGLSPALEMEILISAPVLAAILTVLGRWTLWSKVAALAAALIFATLGLVIFLPRLMAVSTTQASPARSMVRAAGWLVLMTLLSVCGGVLVAGLLAGTPFMLHVEQFRGIKLIMVIPPLAVAIYYATRCAPRARPLGALLSEGVNFWHLLALVLLAGAGAYYVIRTGNAAPSAASPLEMHLRQTLERILVVRPRFKEFLLGFPAWILAAVLIWEKRGQPLIWLLVLAAAIGQADVVDTFCHIHTPYLTSLLRVGNGLWLGVLFGFAGGVAALWWIWRGNRPGAARSSGASGNGASTRRRRSYAEEAEIDG